MAKLNFEEYRQAWETGPHWELKREFMEKYQDDFPEDRLLCLAQAYSNIELLHCSYPDPVMLQIHELSKQLDGCKRFREVKNNDKPELQARPPGKRSASDNLNKPFKFIKFYSVESSQATDGSATGDNVSVYTTKPNSFSEKKTSLLKTPPSLNVSSSINSTSTLGFYESNSKCKLLILTLSQSPDFNLITEIAAGRKSLKIKSMQSFQEIEKVVELLNLKRLVHYKFEIMTSGSKPVFLCEFYIGNTLISSGRCATEKSSRSIAAAYALQILSNVSNLPVKTLNDLRSTTDKETLCFLQKFLLKVTNVGLGNAVMYVKIRGAADSLNCTSDVTYFCREDFESPLNARVYYCDLVIKKVLICTARRGNKSNAQRAAAGQGIPDLDSFFKKLNPELEKTEKDSKFKVSDKSSTLCTFEHPISSAPLKTVTKLTTDSLSSGVDKSKEPISLSKSVVDNNNSRKDINLKQPSVVYTKTMIASFSKPGSIRINYELLNNSLEQKFVILDSCNDNQVQTPQKILNDSAQYCKKSMSFTYDCDSIPEGSMYRCELLFAEESIGFGAGVTKVEAKTTASEVALQKLEKQFYTIKVKNEIDESFVVKRDEMMNASVVSNVVSDSNVGCRMLKMMGWTGGGIGKTSGITEPIMASEHRFTRGLGFEEHTVKSKKFQENIESLLREFSQTDTTSDLVFATDFTKAERKIIHGIACKFGLNGSSRGKEARQLFVKHKLNVTELLNHLVKAGGCTQKYELVDKST